MCKIPKIVTLFVIAFFSLSVNSAENPANSDVEKKELAKQLELEDAKKRLLELKAENQKKEMDVSAFGFGVGFGSLILRDEDIKYATIDNGIVRITNEEKYKMGFWATTSWIHDSFPTTQVGIGPFMGVQFGDDNRIINSFAIGLDISLKRLSPKYPLDFQIGYGFTRAKHLVDGYEEGVGAPVGASQVPLKDVTERGWVLIVSYKL